MLTRPVGSIGRTSFRNFMSLFPSGVAVVTGTLADNSPTGFTCTSLCSVSADPPMLLISAATAGRSTAAIAVRGKFAINLLHSAAAAERFAAPVQDRFDAVVWHRTGHGLPALTEDALAVVDCMVSGCHSVADHTVFFGRPVAISWLTQPDSASPLLYGQRRFARWPD